MLGLLGYRGAYHQARRPPWALDAFEADISRGTLQDAEEIIGLVCPQQPPGKGPAAAPMAPGPMAGSPRPKKHPQIFSRF